jgi:hypothetical protein
VANRWRGFRRARAASFHRTCAPPGSIPPDLRAAGLDLDALLVVHVPGDKVHAVPKAAEMLLRSGALGAIVLDLPRGKRLADGPWQGRLLALAREHQTLVIVLTDTPAHQSSLGPLVSVRLEPKRERAARGFLLTPVVLKNKSGLLLDLPPLVRRGPVGLP